MRLACSGRLGGNQIFVFDFSPEVNDGAWRDAECGEGASLARDD